MRFMRSVVDTFGWLFLLELSGAAIVSIHECWRRRKMRSLAYGEPDESGI
ncbi:MAG TPA: hypothetical protein VLT57_20275 [Bryobacteraceae bacterium]|nr:hypothetical protein [Bryobacteraceae bacterium]